jgi:proteasome accessory factor C
MSAPGGAVGQLSRLLALIPWLVGRPGVGVDETAAEFGVTPAQLRKDLELAFMCGLPGHLPDDLIDVQLEGDRIVVSNADTISRPLRLRPDEAVALLVGLRTLAAVPGLHSRDALDRATAKLERAAGDAADAAGRITVAVESEPAVGATLAAAVGDHRVVRLRYYVPARDEVTERDVDPMRLLVVDGRSYLEGWCRRAEDVRLFRLDRVESVEVRDEPAAVPAGARTRNLGEDLFTPAPDNLRVVVDLAPAARWVADAYPYESAQELADGSLRLTLPVSDPAWVVRLALRLGGQAVVREPADLAARLHQTAADALAAHLAAPPSG